MYKDQMIIFGLPDDDDAAYNWKTLTATDSQSIQQSNVAPHFCLGPRVFI